MLCQLQGFGWAHWGWSLCWGSWASLSARHQGQSLCCGIGSLHQYSAATGYLLCWAGCISTSRCWGISAGISGKKSGLSGLLWFSGNFQVMVPYHWRGIFFRECTLRQSWCLSLLHLWAMVPWLLISWFLWGDGLLDGFYILAFCFSWWWYLGCWSVNFFGVVLLQLLNLSAGQFLPLFCIPCPCRTSYKPLSHLSSIFDNSEFTISV